MSITSREELARYLSRAYHNLGGLCGKSEMLPCGNLSDAVNRYVQGYESWPSRSSVSKLAKDLQISESAAKVFPEGPPHFEKVEDECEMRVLALDAWHDLVTWCKVIDIDPETGTVQS